MEGDFLDGRALGSPAPLLIDLQLERNATGSRLDLSERRGSLVAVAPLAALKETKPSESKPQGSLDHQDSLRRGGGGILANCGVSYCWNGEYKAGLTRVGLCDSIEEALGTFSPTFYWLALDIGCNPQLARDAALSFW